MELKELTEKLVLEPSFGHRLFFSHPQESPHFHEEVIELFWNGGQYVVVEAFRDGAKSTLCEEYTCLSSAMKRFKNILIVGSSWERAKERLSKIKREIEYNEKLNGLFGNMRGKLWTEDKVTLSNETMIQVAGRDQSIRGVKHLDARPDLCVIDDLEDEESVRTPEAREKTLRWFTGVLLPALDPKGVIRMLGTPLEPDCLIERLSKDPAWNAKKYPIEFMGRDGRESSWPDRFPLEWIDRTKEAYTRLGNAREYHQEYMCEALQDESRVFRREMIKHERVHRKWEPVIVMVDPARTIGAKSSETGFGVWSWTGRRIIIWDAYGKLYLPDEIVEEIFALNEKYAPVAIGVEEDGLAQFILQPLRRAMLERGIHLPIVPMLAPKDRSKLDFIKGLQPFYSAGEVIHAKEIPELEAQLLNFPTGKLDVLNTIAYSMRLNQGKPVYEEFYSAHVIEGLKPYGAEKPHLMIHADKSTLVAVMAQYDGKKLRILRDWVCEGEPVTVLQNILKLARIAYQDYKIILHPSHYEYYSGSGLRHALKDCRKGSPSIDGRKIVSELMQKNDMEVPMFLVSPEARHTVLALAGGFAREIKTDGTLAAEPKKNSSRLVMEGVECFAGLMKESLSSGLFGEEGLNYSYTSEGKPYLSSLPRVH